MMNLTGATVTGHFWVLARRYDDTARHISEDEAFVAAMDQSQASGGRPVVIDERIRFRLGGAPEVTLTVHREEVRWDDRRDAARYMVVRAVRDNRPQWRSWGSSSRREEDPRC